ncbi:type II secretion system protein, partial [bacterium]|nr:type II secretion system protein [bacterium]
DLGFESFARQSLRANEVSAAADFRTDGVEDEVRANPDSEQKERTCGEATNSDSLRAWRKSKTIPNALNTRHSETPQAGSESVKKCAFTLAEVLITLGIIGVVAALTIPTLMQKTNQKETVSKVKKAYSVLSSAVSLAIAHDGTVDKWGIASDDSVSANLIGGKIIPYLNIVKDCGNEFSDCFYNGEYKDLNGVFGANYSSHGGIYYNVLLSDGTAMMFRTTKDDCQNNGACIKVYVDINGTKGPNYRGKDMFIFDIYANKVVPAGDGSDCNLNGVGASCASYILKNDNADYLN